MSAFAVAINRCHVGKAPYPAPRGFWDAYNSAFSNELLTVEALAAAIRSGFAYCSWHATRRKADAFVQGQHVALDFDTEDERSTLDALAADPLIAEHAAILHTTPSHTAEKPRARVIFLLDRPIRDAGKYTLLARALLWKYGHADETCKDACRLFYGAKDCDLRILPNVLTLEAAARLIVAPYKAHMAEVEREREAAREAARARYGDVQAGDEVKAAYVDRAFEREAESLARAPSGQRHHTLLKAAIRLGGFLGAPWVPLGCVDEQRIYDTLTGASVKNGEVGQYGEANTLQTIRDGISYAKPRDEPIWTRNERGETVATEPSALLPDVALTPEQVERERAAIEKIRQEAWWQGYHAGMSDAAREFWLGMGATEEFIEALQLGYDDEHEDLTIPYFDERGELVNIEYRQTLDLNDVCYESELPALLRVKEGAPGATVLLLPDALEAIRAARYDTLAAYAIYALPHLAPDQRSMARLSGRRVVVMATRADERITALGKHAKVIQLPFAFPEMVRKGMTAQEITHYIRQAG